MKHQAFIDFDNLIFEQHGLLHSTSSSSNEYINENNHIFHVYFSNPFLASFDFDECAVDVLRLSGSEHLRLKIESGPFLTQEEEEQMNREEDEHLRVGGNGPIRYNNERCFSSPAALSRSLRDVSKPAPQRHENHVVELSLLKEKITTQRYRDPNKESSNHLFIPADPITTGSKEWKPLPHKKACHRSAMLPTRPQ